MGNANLSVSDNLNTRQLGSLTSQRLWSVHYATFDIYVNIEVWEKEKYHSYGSAVKWRIVQQHLEEINSAYSETEAGSTWKSVSWNGCRFWTARIMTGPNVAGGGEREENTASPPTSAWCTSTSVGSTMFEFTWNIADYQRKKESIKRDDSIQSSTFTIQVHPVKMENFEICNSGKQQEIAVVLDFPTKWCCRGRGERQWWARGGRWGGDIHLWGCCCISLSGEHCHI